MKPLNLRAASEFNCGSISRAAGNFEGTQISIRSRMPRIPKATTMPPASKIAGWSPSNGQMAIALSRTAGARRSRQPAIAAFPT